MLYGKFIGEARSYPAIREYYFNSMITWISIWGNKWWVR